MGIITEYVDKVQANLPRMTSDLFLFLSPYVDEIISTIETYVDFALNSSQGKLVEKKVGEIVKLLVTKIDELMKMYPEEIQAIQDFIFVYVNLCLEYANWTINTIVEYPPVQKALEYIATHVPAFIISFIKTILSYLN